MVKNKWTRRKYERTTQEQLEFFITFSKQYPDILKNSYGAKGGLIYNLWNELAESLNDMRGPTRSADKWKECLKNRINQIRCRARKSMLEWNYKSVHSKKCGLVDKPGKVETDDQHIAEVNCTTQTHIKEEFSNDMDNVIKEEIPVDLETAVSEQSLAWMDMDTSSQHSNNFVGRESSHITQDQLKIFIALAKKYCGDDNADTWNRISEALNTVDGSIQCSADEWKERLVEWKNHVSKTVDGSEGKEFTNNASECDQEALQLLKRMLNEKPVLYITEIHNLQKSGFQQSELETDLKEELIHDSYSDTLPPAVSDNEDVNVEDNFMTKNKLHCDDTNAPVSANNDHTNLKPSPLHSSTETLTKDFMDLVRESIIKREEREERAIVQQKLITDALELLNTNLETMTNAILKFNAKLDKL